MQDLFRSKGALGGAGRRRRRRRGCGRAAQPGAEARAARRLQPRQRRARRRQAAGPEHALRTGRHEPAADGESVGALGTSQFTVDVIQITRRTGSMIK